jgi:hypothetical protein
VKPTGTMTHVPSIPEATYQSNGVAAHDPLTPIFVNAALGAPAIGLVLSRAFGGGE